MAKRSAWIEPVSLIAMVPVALWSCPMVTSVSVTARPAVLAGDESSPVFLAESVVLPLALPQPVASTSARTSVAFERNEERDGDRCVCLTMTILLGPRARDVNSARRTKDCPARERARRSTVVDEAHQAALDVSSLFTNGGTLVNRSPALSEQPAACRAEVRRARSPR